MTVYAEIIFAGFGGQGVLLAGQTLAKCSMWHGLQVSWIPSYGPEMRGGTANCTVVLSDRPIASPCATQYDIAVLFNQPSCDKFLPKVRDGGTVFFDEAAVKQAARPGVTLVPVPATRTADAIGSIRVLNMVMLGALVKKANLLPVAEMLGAFDRLFTGKKSQFLELNRQAVTQGAALV